MAPTDQEKLEIQLPVATTTVTFLDGRTAVAHILNPGMVNQLVTLLGPAVELYHNPATVASVTPATFTFTPSLVRNLSHAAILTNTASTHTVYSCQTLDDQNLMYLKQIACGKERSVHFSKCTVTAKIAARRTLGQNYVGHNQVMVPMPLNLPLAQITGLNFFPGYDMRSVLPIGNTLHGSAVFLPTRRTVMDIDFTSMNRHMHDSYVTLARIWSDILTLTLNCRNAGLLVAPPRAIQTTMVTAYNNNNTNTSNSESAAAGQPCHIVHSMAEASSILHTPDKESSDSDSDAISISLVQEDEENQEDNADETTSSDSDDTEKTTSSDSDDTEKTTSSDSDDSENTDSSGFNDTEKTANSGSDDTTSSGSANIEKPTSFGTDDVSSSDSDNTEKTASSGSDDITSSDSDDTEKTANSGSDDTTSSGSAATKKAISFSTDDISSFDFDIYDTYSSDSDDSAKTI